MSGETKPGAVSAQEVYDEIRETMDALCWEPEDVLAILTRFQQDVERHYADTVSAGLAEMQRLLDASRERERQLELLYQHCLNGTEVTVQGSEAVTIINTIKASRERERALEASEIAAALDAARADERERCAKIAESDRTHKTDDGWRTSTAIAKAIRAAAPEAKKRLGICGRDSHGGPHPFVPYPREVPCQNWIPEEPTP